MIEADIHRVWRELTKTDEAQGAVFNAWLHTTGLVPGARLAAGVEVTLEVTRMPAGTRTAKSMQQGGPMILKSLKAIAETGRPPLGSRVMYCAFDLLGFVLPRRSRSEHWPIVER